MKNKINKLLRVKGFKNRVENLVSAPQLDRYEIEFKHYEDIKKYKRIEEDLQVFLKNSLIRVVVDGGVFIEIPRQENVEVKKEKQIKNKFESKVQIGIDTQNNIVEIDFKENPHLLISGASGTGKTIMLKSIIDELSKQKVNINVVDTKVVSFKENNKFNLINSPERALDILEEEIDYVIDERYKKLRELDKENVYQLTKEEMESNDMKPIFFIVDEFADLLLDYDYNEMIELFLKSISAIGRGAGVHLILATQRADSKVLHPLIKANMSIRLAFKVASISNSKVAIDVGGAEKLIGNGDFLMVKSANITRGQGFIN